LSENHKHVCHIPSYSSRLKLTWRRAFACGARPPHHISWRAATDAGARRSCTRKSGVVQSLKRSFRMKIAGTIPIREVEENFINIQPIPSCGPFDRRGDESPDRLRDGYSTCDQCRKPFRLDKITKPPIAEFHKDLASSSTWMSPRHTRGASRLSSSLSRDCGKRRHGFGLSARTLHRVPCGRECKGHCSRSSHK